MAEVKLEEENEPRELSQCPGMEPSQIKEEPELCIKQEPEEFSFHIRNVKSEDEEDKSPVLNQRLTEKTKEEPKRAEAVSDEEHTDSSSDTDQSEDYSHHQAPSKRSYAMILPDFSGTDLRSTSCSQCGRTFGCNSELKRHMLVHSDERPYKCPVCKKASKYKSVLRKHMKIHTRPGICSLCGQTFSRASDLGRHKKYVHQKYTAGKRRTYEGDKTLHSVSSVSYRPYSCSQCEQKFDSNSRLQSHMSVHSGVKPHKCLVCKKHFTYKYTLDFHLKSHSAKRTCVCEFCKMAFKHKQYLAQHRRHTCPLCKTCLLNKNNLNEHLRTHEEKGAQSLDTVSDVGQTYKQYSCSHCGRPFAFMLLLLNHMQVHSGERPHECQVCGKPFKHKSHLKGHMNIHTRDKYYDCSLCGQTFAQKSSLNKHEKKLHLDCPFCKTSFPTVFDMKEHLQTHGEHSLSGTTNKPYICSLCGRKFAFVILLQNHMRIHLERPYKCQVCEKTFQKEIQLKRHMNIHTREKYFDCSFCGQTFTKKSSLDKHMKNLHLDCPFCKKTFPTLFDMKEHLQTHEEDFPPETGNRSYSCSQCERKFYLHSEFKKHAQVHLEDKTQECPVCKKMFQYKYSLNLHLRSHMEKGTNAASVSGKTDENKSDSKQHFKNIFHVCPFCKTIFPDKTALNEHLRTHVTAVAIDEVFVLSYRT